MTIVGSVIEGEFTRYTAQADATTRIIRGVIKKEKVKGFPEVIVSKDLADGLSYL